MPPKVKFSKDAIVEAAFEIAKAEGIDQITIRKVADRVGSSIAPIYVNFPDIEALKQAVRVEIRELSQQLMSVKHSPDPFLNIGIASLKFARAYPVLFKSLAMDKAALQGEVGLPMEQVLGEMRKEPAIADVPDEEMMAFLFRIRAFQLGLSIMDLNGSLPEQADEAWLIDMLDQTAADLMAGALLRLNGTSGDDGRGGR
ncbi:TetR/AcrR family transcriptional regulator [Paenibacillaceae bacterium WGS1546]|uniref:TetR/AcrR family transcriptional regulator n=1 Tax=Cohnella sp. WGS1546 TaxID=3366810 RepID=UPI00372CF01A